MGATAAIVGASAAASLGSAALTSSAAGSASRTQANAASGANALQASIYQQNLARLNPFISSGTNLLSQFLGNGSGMPGGAPGGTPPMMPPSGGGGYGPMNQNLMQLLGGSLRNSGGSSAMQDIARAMSMGIPISDGQWAQAGLPPGGGPVGQQLQMAMGQAGGQAPGAPSGGNPTNMLMPGFDAMNPTAGNGMTMAGSGGALGSPGSIPTLASLSQPTMPFAPTFTPPNPMPPSFSPVNMTPPSFTPTNPFPQGFSSSYSAPPAFTPFQPTEQQLEATPGYQFTLDQGLKNVNNANSAKGWGLSGAGLKGIADYTTGLADQTYQQQYGNYNTNYNMLLGANQAGFGNALGGYGANLGAFQAGFGNYNTNYQNTLQNSQTGFQNAINAWFPQYQQFQSGFGNQLQNYSTGLGAFQTGFGNYLNQNNQLYNMAMGPISLATNAGLGVGTQGVNTGANMGSNITGMGNALGAGTLAGANAWSGAPTSALLNYGLYNSLLGGGGGSSGSPMASFSNGLWTPGAGGFPTSLYGNGGFPIG